MLEKRRDAFVYRRGQELSAILVKKLPVFVSVRDYIVTHNTFSGYLKALSGIDKKKIYSKTHIKALAG